MLKQGFACKCTIWLHIFLPSYLGFTFFWAPWLKSYIKGKHKLYTTTICQQIFLSTQVLTYTVMNWPNIDELLVSGLFWDFGHAKKKKKKKKKNEADWHTIMTDRYEGETLLLIRCLGCLVTLLGECTMVDLSRGNFQSDFFPWKSFCKAFFKQPSPISSFENDLFFSFFPFPSYLVNPSTFF